MTVMLADQRLSDNAANDGEFALRFDGGIKAADAKTSLQLFKDKAASSARLAPSSAFAVPLLWASCGHV
jgi:hypothetical protein